jgi:hypothetical protein
MKKVLFVIMAICFISTLALAEEAVKPADDKVVATQAPSTAVVAAKETVTTTGTVLTAEPVKEQAPSTAVVAEKEAVVTTDSALTAEPVKEQTPAVSTAVVAANPTTTTTDAALTAEPVKEPAPAAADLTQKVTEKAETTK